MSDLPSSEELDAMTKDELLAVANDDMSLGVPVNDTKAEVRAAIDNAIAQSGDSDTSAGGDPHSASIKQEQLSPSNSGSDEGDLSAGIGSTTYVEPDSPGEGIPKSSDGDFMVNIEGTAQWEDVRERDVVAPSES